MIRYPISEATLRDRIATHKAGWLERAGDRTAGFVASGKYDAKSGIWSEIKDVYRRLQHQKCAYCERLLPAEHGATEHDVEHYRPKARVRHWPVPPGPLRRMEDEIHDGRSGGYYWLAYEPLNYATSCKTCNSALKGDKFPILGATLEANDPIALPSPAALMATEQPALPYPISDIDDDPEHLLQFEGHVVVPARDGSARQKLRAMITIEFFGLNRRSTDLARGRARVVTAVFEALERHAAATTDEAREDAEIDLEVCRHPGSAFSACAKAFEALCRSDPARAWRFYRAAKALIRAQVLR